MATSVLFLTYYVYLLLQITIVYGEENNAASKFKEPNSDTPEEVASLWKEKDEALWSYVESNVPAILEHTGHSTFDEHLRGVQSVLRFWDAKESLTSAGLFHSIYGTEGFQGFSLPLSERETISKLIGPYAEKMSFVFCMVDRTTVDKTVTDWEPNQPDNNNNTTYMLTARPELGRFKIELSKEEWLDFIELTLADWLEQVEGASQKPSNIYHWNIGEAYAYRRLAYRKMSELLAVERYPRLSIVAPHMFQAVMATESQMTRHLVQRRTPPISDAAMDAINALRAAGEPIPRDFAPEPMNIECNA